MSNRIPFFSIVIPTYNHAHFMGRCLDSILTQSFQNWEAIVVNNFSEDNTIEVVESYNDPRIRLINNANGGIIAVSRNKGISLARGEWICFLDSDDWWYSNKLEIVYKYISNNSNIDVVCHDLIINYTLSGKKKLMPCGPIVPNLYNALLKQGNRFPNSALSIKKSIIKKFNILINESKYIISVEDYDLSLQLAACNAIFGCINMSLGEYIIEKNNISSTKKHIKNLEFLLRKHVFEIQTFESNKVKLWKKVYSRLNTIKATESYRQSRYWDSLGYFVIAFKLSKSSFLKYVSERITLSIKRFLASKVVSQ